MSVTSLLSGTYMWWAKIPHAPFGQKGVRLLLAARGFGGFFGGMIDLLLNKPYLANINSLVYGFYCE